MFGTAISLVFSLALGDMNNNITKAFIKLLGDGSEMRASQESVLVLSHIFPNRLLHTNGNTLTISITNEEWDWILNEVQVCVTLVKAPLFNLIMIRDIRTLGDDRETRIGSLNFLKRNAENNEGLVRLVSSYDIVVAGINFFHNLENMNTGVQPLTGNLVENTSTTNTSSYSNSSNNLTSFNTTRGRNNETLQVEENSSNLLLFGGVIAFAFLIFKN